eukprot:CAMPEP_0181460168 /NCGR_PEP_ID=MMETSP1110-20121109/33200_1 /TAXON_ID=174948 /ORGANISM="Symbiodinium sp., Strain CCMP421" /LENGTH=94 /DNA_ID=CAMNT_0023584707 /DNA_START=287 /DNA_END=568 /DNA_ORIENTATION=+
MINALPACLRGVPSLGDALGEDRGDLAVGERWEFGELGEEGCAPGSPKEPPDLGLVTSSSSVSPAISPGAKGRSPRVTDSLCGFKERILAKSTG